MAISPYIAGEGFQSASNCSSISKKGFPKGVCVSFHPLVFEETLLRDSRYSATSASASILSSRFGSGSVTAGMESMDFL
jgi:hypothetical protein